MLYQLFFQPSSRYPSDIYDDYRH